MKPAPFDYHRPRSLEEALALLAQYGSDAKPLAGGQSLIPAMNFRLATPAVLIDLNEIREIDHIEPGGAPGAPGALGAVGAAGAPALLIGAMTRHRRVERSEFVATHAPLLAAAMPYVAHAAIRTRGTLGGSLAHADPAAELPAVMLALDAHFTVTGAQGPRTVSADDFFVGLFTTTLEPGELLTEVAIPEPAANTRFAFQEIARRHGDFALAGVAAAVTQDEEQRCTGARIALLSVGERPALATHAARALIGQRLSTDTIRAAAAAAATQDIDPPGDIHASARYRRQLVEVLVRRSLAGLKPGPTDEAGSARPH